MKSIIQQGLLTEDRNTLYPIIQEIPQLLAPEGISLKDSSTSLIDIHKKQYDEPYKEMATYEEISAQHLLRENLYSALGENIMPHGRISKAEKESFPNPIDLWLDAKDCLVAQETAYNYLTPISDKIVLQIGGHGSHLIKFLIVGAKESWLVSPILGELKRARLLSKLFHVEDRFFSVQGIAEELPFKKSLFNRVYSGGCLHHTRLEMSAPEIYRVLKVGGKGSFVDPILTLPYQLFVRPFYSQGLGRVNHAECEPITSDQVSHFMELFDGGSVFRYRTFLHFPLIMATRYLKAKLSTKTIKKIEKVDSFLGNSLPFVKKHFSPIICLCVDKK